MLLIIQEGGIKRNIFMRLQQLYIHITHYYYTFLHLYQNDFRIFIALTDPNGKASVSEFAGYFYCSVN